jgi:nuclear pore complex protein Nup107
MTQRIVIRRRVVAARRSGTMESLREGDFERRAMVVAESAVRDGTSSSMMQTMRGGDDADDVLMGDVRDVVDVAGDDTRALNPLVPVSSYVASDGDGGEAFGARKGLAGDGSANAAAASAANDGDDARAEEFAFAEVLAKVKTEGASAGAAAAMFEDACWLRARELRMRAEARRRRAPSAAAKDVVEAEALEREAHSWSLIYHLLGDGATVERESAGREIEMLNATPREDGGARGNFLPPPLRSRLRCASRDETRDPVTFRLNRIIAWLESNASSALRRAELDGTAFDGRFLRDECAWRETADALNSSAKCDPDGNPLSTSLDPDGPMRTNAVLHPSNADAEERLCKRLWKLIRAGNIREARDLCSKVGQHWRAASLGGAAGWGPAPVGLVADEELERDARKLLALRDMDTLAAQNEVDLNDDACAAECDGIGANRRALWKWTCMVAARHIAKSAKLSQLPLAQHEASVYGALCGDLQTMLTACEGDWESTTWAYARALFDLRVDSVVNSGRVLSDVADIEVGEVICDENEIENGDDDAVKRLGQPRWPTLDVINATPKTVEEILLVKLPEKFPDADAHRTVQTHLILGKTKELVLDHLLQLIFPEEELASDGERVSLRPLDAGLTRFTAHALLFLESLLAEGGGLSPGGELYFHLNKVLNLYVVHLIANKRYALVPAYVVHLRHPLLIETYANFLDLLAPAVMSRKSLCFAEASLWMDIEGLGGWREIVTRSLSDSRSLDMVHRGPDYRRLMLQWSTVAVETYPEAATHACLLVRQLMCQRTSINVFSGDAQVDGELRAREILVDELPEGVPGQARANGASESAAELGDWARYLSATEAITAWKQIWSENESKRLDIMAQNTRPYPPDPLPAIDEDELCAAQRAIDAVLTLVRTKNWLDDAALCGAEDEMAQNNLLLRVVAIPVLKGFVDSNGGVRASDVEQIATDLETLISSKFEQGEVSVNATRGIARGESPVHAEGEYGQVMVQISATLPDDTSVEDLARVRQDVALAMSDCAKGDLPGQEVTLDIQSVDGNSAALVHALCRAICIPSIMMQAAQIEAAMRVGTTRVVELTADPEYGIFKYFSSTELKWILELARESGLTLL